MSSRSSSSSTTDLANWQSARYTLFLRVHSADKLQLSTSLSSYCKLYLGETPVVSKSLGNMLKIKDQTAAEHRTFITKVSTSQSKLTAVWNEKFEIPVEDPKKQILSVRVKSQHQLISPVIGACAIQLKQLRVAQTVDQSFPLFKGSTQVGAIRMQIMLRENGGEVPVARVVGEVVAVKKAAKKIVKKVYNESDEEDDRQPPRDSLLALQLERRRLDEQEEERKRKERDREVQLALEKQRIDARMEQLQREEDERKRLKQEEEERRRVAAERLAAEQEEQRVRRQWELQEEQLARRDGHIINTDPFDNQIDGDDSKKKKKRSNDEQPSARRSTLSLRDMLDMVVQDALPSDSEDLDTEDEKELIRQIAKLKMQMKKKKKEARQRLQRDYEDPKKVKTVKVVYVYEDEETERRHKAKSFNDDLYQRSPVAKSKKDKHSKSQGDVIYRGSGSIQSMVPGAYEKKAAKENKNEDTAAANKNNNNQNGALSLATLAVGLGGGDDEIGGDVIPDTVDALQNLVPIGRFLAKVAENF